MHHNLCVVCNKTFWSATRKKVCDKDICKRTWKNLMAKQRRIMRKRFRDEAVSDSLLRSVFGDNENG